MGTIATALRSELSRLFEIGRGEGLGAQLVRAGLGSLILKLAGRLLMLATAVLLARLLGAEGYGVYVYALAVVTVLAVPAKLGLSTLVVREVATYHVRAEWPRLGGVIRRTNQTVAGFSLALGLLLGGATWLLADRFSSDGLATLRWALLLVPVMALGDLRGAALRGLERVMLGQLPEQLIRPGLLVGFLLVLIATGSSLGPETAMALHVGAAVVAFLIGAWLLRGTLPPEVRRVRPAYEDRRWLESAFHLAFLAGAQVIHKQAGILMLGVFLEAGDVGIYRVAATGATLVSFALESLTNVVAPHVARLHVSGDAARLQRMVTSSARITFFAALPIAIAFTFLGGPILAIVFGTDFARGHASLAILCCAQLVSVAVGPVGPLLNMSGHERVTARSFAWSAAANVLLSALLIPALGMAGAAIATAITFAGWRLFLWRQVLSRVGIDSSVVRRIDRRDRR